MKKASRIMSAILALVLVLALVPTTAFAASSDDYYITYSKVSSSWLAKSEMVDWSTDSWTRDWTDYLTDTGRSNPTFSQIVEAAYNSTVEYARYSTTLLDSYVTYDGKSVQIKNIPNADLAYYVPQYTFSELLDQVSDYSNNGGSRPRWTCGDYARFMVGLLRSQGIPAYIEIGYQSSTGRYHSRVAVVDESNKRIYYSDPTYGITSNNTSKWMWLTWSEYSSDYSQSYISTEKLPSKQPPAVNPDPKPPVVRPEYPSAYAISVPADCRYDDVIVPITKNGVLIASVPMRVIWYDGAWWFTARDACMVLKDTTRSVKVSWDSTKNTLVFNRGNYVSNGTEVNWTNGTRISIDKTSQAYMLPPAFFGNEQTNIRVISIGGTTYVRPIDIAKMMDFDGSVAVENELGGNFKFK
ncbi:MAG: hypothetical protein ACK5MU_02600 [Candidatus Saccharimonadales bacterium]